MSDMEVFLQHLNTIIEVIGDFYTAQQLDIQEQVWWTQHCSMDVQERERVRVWEGGVGGMSPAALLKRNMKDYDYMLRNMLNI